jgi:hypothetical protein
MLNQKSKSEIPKEAIAQATQKGIHRNIVANPKWENSKGPSTITT